MAIVSIFNNKGGVGKTTLTYHLASAISELGKRVIVFDFDPQSNLTLHAMEESKIEELWEAEEGFIDAYGHAREENESLLHELSQTTRTVHFLLKPIEDGVDMLDTLPPLFEIRTDCYLLPGRLSLHQFENKMAQASGSLLSNDFHSIKTVTALRSLIDRYMKDYQADIALIDTSPSLGTLNQFAISFSDAFFIPAAPDMFSLYGIKNITASLIDWKHNFDIAQMGVKPTYLKNFPEKFVRFMGYSIYNARRSGSRDAGVESLASAHSGYLHKIEESINDLIPNELKLNISNIYKSLDSEVIFTHNTFPSIAQALKCPIWEAPEKSKTHPELLESVGVPKPQGAHISAMRETRNGYIDFANVFLSRLDHLADS